MTSLTKSDALFARLSDFLEGRMGLHFPETRRRDLERGITSAASDFGFADGVSCAEWLLSSHLTKEQIEVLASHLTIGETYFFRDTKLFDALEQHVLPELIRKRRGKEQRLRLWSAGCCTGEEPYSLAILISRLLPDLRDWQITILATDLNPRFLQRAAAGEYRDWSFRSTPEWVRERYFATTDGDHSKINAQIKRMVKFSHLNLAEDVYPSLLNDTNAMDVILCRNVIMYFTAARAKTVTDGLSRCLVDGGCLIVSPTEAPHMCLSQFEAVYLPGTTLYRRDSRRMRRTEEGGVAPPLPVCDVATDLGLESRPQPVVATHDGPPAAPSLQQPLADLGEPSGQPVDVERAEPQAGEPPQPSPYDEAAALYGQGRYAEAAEMLEGLLSQGPSALGALGLDGEPSALLARAYANLGKLAEALDWVEKALDADKVNSGHHYLRATILREQGRAQEAIASLRRALYLDPDFVVAHFALGSLLRQQGKPGQWTKPFQNALLLLRGYGQEDILPQSEGMTAGRLSEVLASMTEGEART